MRHTHKVIQHMSALSILVAENHINKFYKPILGWGNGGRRAHIGHIAPYMGMCWSSASPNGARKFPHPFISRPNITQREANEKKRSEYEQKIWLHCCLYLNLYHVGRSQPLHRQIKWNCAVSSINTSHNYQRNVSHYTITQTLLIIYCANSLNPVQKLRHVCVPLLAFQ